MSWEILSWDAISVIFACRKHMTLPADRADAPAQAPKANAFCERLIGTVRRECLDYVIPLSEKHVRENSAGVGDPTKSRPNSALVPVSPPTRKNSTPSCHGLRTAVRDGAARRVAERIEPCFRVQSGSQSADK